MPKSKKIKKTSSAKNNSPIKKATPKKESPEKTSPKKTTPQNTTPIEKSTPTRPTTPIETYEPETPSTPSRQITRILEPPSVARTHSSEVVVTRQSDITPERLNMNAIITTPVRDFEEERGIPFDREEQLKEWTRRLIESAKKPASLDDPFTDNDHLKSPEMLTEDALQRAKLRQRFCGLALPPQFNLVNCISDQMSAGNTVVGPAGELKKGIGLKGYGRGGMGSNSGGLLGPRPQPGKNGLTRGVLNDLNPNLFDPFANPLYKAAAKSRLPVGLPPAPPSHTRFGRQIDNKENVNPLKFVSDTSSGLEHHFFDVDYRVERTISDIYLKEGLSPPKLNSQRKNSLGQLNQPVLRDILVGQNSRGFPVAFKTESTLPQNNAQMRSNAGDFNSRTSAFMRSQSSLQQPGYAPRAGTSSAFGHGLAPQFPQHYNDRENTQPVRGMQQFIGGGGGGGGGLNLAPAPTNAYSIQNMRAINYNAGFMPAPAPPMLTPQSSFDGANMGMFAPPGQANVYGFRPTGISIAPGPVPLRASMPVPTFGPTPENSFSYGDQAPGSFPPMGPWDYSVNGSALSRGQQYARGGQAPIPPNTGDGPGIIGSAVHGRAQAKRRPVGYRQK